MIFHYRNSSKRFETVSHKREPYLRKLNLVEHGLGDPNNESMKPKYFSASKCLEVHTPET